MYRMVVWLCCAMSAVAAVAYVLMGMGVIHPGNLTDGSMPVFYYVIPAAYFVMAVLLLSRWRWVRIAEAFIVFFTIAVFYGKYASQPDVMWSVPGLLTKIPQVIMLAGLIYLLMKTKGQKTAVVSKPPADTTPAD